MTRATSPATKAPPAPRTARARRAGPGPLARLVPYALLPLAVICTALANAPWLRSFPASVLAVPLFGAAVIGVLLPVIVNGIGLRRLWITAAIDVVLFVFFELLVVLRDLADVGGLWTGLVHGPSQVLSYALPLVDPRSLLVAPVALCWLSAAILGECLARGWQTVLPYLGLLVAFGLSYAATVRAVADTGEGHRYDTLLAAGLLLALLLMRSARAWIAQNESATTTQPDGVLPLRGLAAGAAVAVVIAAATVAVAQTDVFTGPPRTPRVVPPLDRSAQLTPIAYVSRLRAESPGSVVFTLTVDRQASNYISLANLDTYDGDSWTFDRTFAPSGGVVPADQLRSLRPDQPAVTQQYTIRGKLAGAAWMPFLQRVSKVSGVRIDVDPVTGMVTPAQSLPSNDTYTVRSASTPATLLAMKGTASIGSFGGGGIPDDVQAAVAQLVTTFAAETHVQPTTGVRFLQAVARNLRTTSGLSLGASAADTSPGGASQAPSSSPSRSPSPRSSAQSSARSSTGSGGGASGGTSFADVLTSIRINHSATPEQFATLMCLIARRLGIPARIGTGFRIGTGPLTAGRLYTVRAADAWTWVEVPISGAGWVVLDPSPAQRSGPSTAPSRHGQPSADSPEPNPTNLLNTAPPVSAPLAPVAHHPRVHRLHVDVLLVLLVLLGIVAVVLLAVLLLRKRVRARRRRRAADPRRSLLGAWQESLDVLQEAGLPDLSALTSREVSQATDARFGGEPAEQARYLGDAANAAIFNPDSRVDPAEAEKAWQAHVVLRRSVRRRLSFAERVGAGLRYHRLRSPAAATSPDSWALGARERAAAARGSGRHTGPAGRRRRR